MVQSGFGIKHNRPEGIEQPAAVNPTSVREALWDFAPKLLIRYAIKIRFIKRLTAHQPF